ncbi:MULTISPECIES: hypothetical protein [unclassified Leucobacter]|uniref:hypothetical protein n=1 Tax=unclassified Leucobacter TaxID=2621730 RepID=UPI00301843E9
MPEIDTNLDSIDPDAPVPVFSAESCPRITDPATGEPLVVPSFATLDQARERAQREKNGDLHRLRFFLDHGHEWPLWDTRCGYTAEPSCYGLSLGLVEKIAAWSDTWRNAANELLRGPDINVPLVLDASWYQTGWALARSTAQEIWHMGDVFPEFLNGLRPASCRARSGYVRTGFSQQHRRPE